MKRIALTDNSGSWFNLETAKEFKEGTRWDGRNHISLATGGQWDHQTIYRTKSRRWVLKSWSQWQGSADSYEIVGDSTAANWFVQNGYQESEIPDDIQKIIGGLIAENEI